MRAMILAAGLGKRMRPLTDKTPKPMLTINGIPLIQYHVQNLVKSGVTEIVINHSVMGEQIEAYLGNGNRFGANIVYSPEGETPLETGGGIFQALPLLGRGAFIVINADIWTDYPFKQLPENPDNLAHLVLVNNPGHNREGDFCLEENGAVSNTGQNIYTYSGIGLFRHELFSGCKAGTYPVTPLLRQAATQGQLQGELYTGIWSDIGTPERLYKIESANQK